MLRQMLKSLGSRLTPEADFEVPRSLIYEGSNR